MFIYIYLNHFGKKQEAPCYNAYNYLSLVRFNLTSVRLRSVKILGKINYKTVDI